VAPRRWLSLWRPNRREMDSRTLVSGVERASAGGDFLESILMRQRYVSRDQINARM
jgi:hypothetical protein